MDAPPHPPPSKHRLLRLGMVASAFPWASLALLAWVFVPLALSQWPDGPDLEGEARLEVLGKGIATSGGPIAVAGAFVFGAISFRGRILAVLRVVSALGALGFAVLATFAERTPNPARVIGVWLGATAVHTLVAIGLWRERRARG